MTTFTVFGAPATKGSVLSFVGAGGRLITRPDCKGLAAWSQAVGWAARGAQVALAGKGVPVQITAIFQFVKPPSQPRRLWPTVKPDLDKLTRALLDALTGVAYVDDAQVVRLEITKVYGDDARTTVQIEVW